jgi:NADPH-dependent 2,4-dienoyl-CoA reductase/sulfur reductase-like enzyme
VVILGAGFIGCETGATAVKLGAEVTIVGPGHLPIRRPLGDELAAEVMRRQQQAGTHFKLGHRVVDLLGSDRVTGVRLDDGSELQCDVFIEAIGSHPNVEWLEGNDLDLSDGVLTNHQLNAVREDGIAWNNVWVIGDVARFPNPIFDETPRRVEHWNIPTECAKFVGQSISAVYAGTEPPEVFRPIPSFWSDQFDMHILAFGLLGLATEVKLIDGEISGDCVFGYYRSEKMVGVAGIGMRSVVQSYRKVFE